MIALLLRQCHLKVNGCVVVRCPYACSQRKMVQFMPRKLRQPNTVSTLPQSSYTPQRFPRLEFDGTTAHRRNIHGSRFSYWGQVFLVPCFGGLLSSIEAKVFVVVCCGAPRVSYAGACPQKSSVRGGFRRIELSGVIFSPLSRCENGERSKGGLIEAFLSLLSERLRWQTESALEYSSSSPSGLFVKYGEILPPTNIMIFFSVYVVPPFRVCPIPQGITILLGTFQTTAMPRGDDGSGRRVGVAEAFKRK